ncbi:MFS transporter [Alicyclobacillus acidoterrestris]|uniref:MFS transporter n=1 Tax=Alicyclobacillus suci TaxID=2816080 RepID=UPI001191214A|nr:MFS transporter [Alicyclobacillus suci]GEO28022.1 MFS transporter [Alicyclobacillus acidoterrestris]
MRSKIRFPRAAKASWGMLVLTWLLWLMNANDREIMYRVQPEIVKEWHLSPAAWSAMISGVFLAYALIALPAGILSDRLGRGWRRKISQVWYMVVFTTVSIFIGIKVTSVHWWQFILWRVLGLGAAGGAEATNVAQCAEYWSPEDRGFALGLHHTGYPVGALAGGAVSAWILAAFGGENWRYIFLITPLIGYLLAVALWMFANERTYGQVNDYARANGLTAPEDEAPVRMEVSEQWKLSKSALANRHVLLTVVGAALINFAQTMGLWFLSPYLAFVMGKSPAYAAIIGVVPYITGWVGQLVWGWISDYIGRKKTLVILGIWYAVSILLLTQIHSMGMMWVVLLFWGLGLNAVFPVQYAMMADHAPKAAGSAMGFLLMLVFLGSVPAAPLEGWLIQIGGGWNSYSGYIMGFFVAAVASIVAMLLQLFTKDAKSNVGKESYQAHKMLQS